jgi:hypothetical protein
MHKRVFSVNPLVSKQLFLTVLNEEGYCYGINSPINLKNLQLESQGQNMVHILLQREF